MADEGLRFEAWSMPHVGALTKKFDFSKWVESYILNDRFSDLSDGVLTLPDDFPLKDELFKIDEANHANDVGSMVRVLRGTTPLLHYLVTRSEDRWQDEEPTHKVTLEGLEWLLDRAIVPRYDEPADPSLEPDWIYGAANILGNPGLENNSASLDQQKFYHTQTSGTYTITFNGQTTSAINWFGTFFDVHEALEALSNIQDVVVTGSGSATDPFLIEFLDPAGNQPLITSTATGATIWTFGDGGILDPVYWTKSYHPQTGGEHGTYSIFEVSTEQAHSGTYSLKVDANAPVATDYPGVQQIVNVQGGRTYRGSIWVRPTFSGRFRLIIRTMDETAIALADNQLLTANTWSQIVLAPFVVPTHISQVIFRLGLIESGDLGAWYIDDAELAPGLPADKLGKIMNDIRVAAVANGVLGWLTPTWTTTLDSDLVAWDQNLKWQVARGQTFLQLLEYARRWNYEWAIRWDEADNRFEWDMWNPNGGGQVRANIALTGKAGVSSSGPIVRRPPGATYAQAEGDLGEWGEFLSTTLDDVWGRLERFYSDRQGLESASLDILAERLISRSQELTLGRSVQLEDPSILPWTAFFPGDMVTLNLVPKDVKRSLRVAAVVASKQPDRATPLYEVHFVSPVYTNEAALAQGLRSLTRKFASLTTASRPTIASVPPPPPNKAGGNLSAYSHTGQVFVVAGRHRLTFPSPATILGVVLAVNTAPTGASIICDVHKNGVTIFTTQSTRPTIAAATFASAEAIPQVTAIGIGEYLTLDIDQVGSTIAGADLVGVVHWKELVTA